jgi:hypothetical protein
LFASLVVPGVNTSSVVPGVNATLPIVGAIVCFVMRIAGMRYGLGLPSAAEVADRGLRR